MSSDNPAMVSSWSCVHWYMYEFNCQRAEAVDWPMDALLTLEATLYQGA